MRSSERPAFKPAQVTLLETAEALLIALEERADDFLLRGYLHGEIDVLRQAIQRERAK